VACSGTALALIVKNGTNARKYVDNEHCCILISRVTYFVCFKSLHMYSDINSFQKGKSTWPNFISHISVPFNETISCKLKKLISLTTTYKNYSLSKMVSTHTLPWQTLMSTTGYLLCDRTGHSITHLFRCLSFTAICPLRAHTFRLKTPVKGCMLPVGMRKK
jgi:hypothetical protein